MKNAAYYALALLFTLPSATLAQVDPYSLSLEELMDVPVSIGSRTPLSQRETPGLITVITSEEIRNSGARDMVDVLRQVPGIDFGVTVNNSVALGMRGHVGSYGRILVLMDGIALNEKRYGGAVFGKGFPIEFIERIEIIRGSALAQYGGTAMLGVINIISKSADQLDGVTLTAGVGHTSKVRSREFASVMLGKGGDSPVKLTAMAHMGRSLRSDRIYQDVFGSTFSLAEANASYPEFVNLGLQVGNFSARFLHENSRINDRDGAFTISAADSRNFYTDNAVQVQYRHQTEGGLTLKPSLLIQAQTPRKTIRANGTLKNRTEVDRVQVTLPLQWNMGDQWYFGTGLEYRKDRYSSEVRSFPLDPLPFSATTVNSLYGEALWRNPWGDLTANLRLEEHSQAGLLHSERLGYTHVVGRWHTKLMAGYGHRIPIFEAYSERPTSTRGEKNRTWEFEGGYRVNSDSQLTLNLFDITVYDSLIITNHGKVNTRGLEFAYKTRKNWGYADVTYSYYQADIINTAPVQIIDQITGVVVEDDATLGSPTHKLTANLNYKLSPSLLLNPSLVYLGPRWGYVSPDVGFTGGTITKFSASPLLNIALRWDNSVTKNLDLTLGLYNVFNSEVAFISPLNTFHPPLPGMSRELVVQGQYKF